MPAPTTSAAPERTRDEAASASRRTRHRAEVQGLRAVAVLLVVLYHVFTDRVSGGVDVFLFISAFFLTGGLLRRLEVGERPSVRRRWLRTVHRLVPLAGLTVAVTYGLMAVFYSPAQNAQWRLDGLASVTYWENWLLASRAVDYYATDGSTASPFQHFWSLSVQGQVFLLWPVLFAAAAVVVRRTALRPVPVVTALFGTVFAASFVWSVVSTAARQEFAYFDTSARLWEFALASLAAVAAERVRPGPRLSLALGWVGLAGLLAVGPLVDVQGAFPGWIALWPLAAAACVMLAGPTGSRLGVDTLLAARPMVAVGDAAYALYLIHWPLLTTWLVATGRPRTGVVDGVAVIVFSLVLALLLTRWVDRPLARWGEGPGRGLGTAALAGGVVLALAVAAGLWQAADRARMQSWQAAGAQNNPGAAVLAPDYVDRADPRAPTLPLISGDYPRPEYLGLCPGGLELREGVDGLCRVVHAPEDPQGVVLLLGNSHVMQWTPAAEDFARAHDLTLMSFVRGGCMLGTADEQVVPYRVCRDFAAEVGDVVDHVDPDVVILQSTVTAFDGSESQLQGTRDWVRRFSADGRHVLALRDNPRFRDALPVCAERHGPESDHCALPYPQGVDGEGPFGRLEDDVARVTELDMNDLVCPERICRPVVGNLFVYWDDGHITPDYVRSLAPIFTRRVEEKLAEAGYDL